MRPAGRQRPVARGRSFNVLRCGLVGEIERHQRFANPGQCRHRRENALAIGASRSHRGNGRCQVWHHNHAPEIARHIGAGVLQGGAVAIEEYSEHTLVCALQAQTYKLPFMPTRAGIGTDMPALHPETTRLETDAATGRHYLACTPLKVDVAVVHAHAGDRRGNVRVDPKLLWLDNEIINAATTKIATVERIVETSEFTAEPHRTTYPHFMIDALAEVPWGAYPSSMFPNYIHDKDFFNAYSAAAMSRDDDAFSSFWNERVIEPDAQGDYLDANGGAATLMRIARRTT